MQFLYTFLLAIAAMPSAYSLPSSGQIEERDVQTVTLIFQGAAASYNLSIPANGQEYSTSTSSILPVM